MTKLKNRVQLIGNLGMDPEVRTTASGKTLCRMTLATNEVYTSAKGEKVTETQWHNLIAWGKTAELAQKLLAKGKEVAVDGKLTSSSYEDKEGVKRYRTEVVVNELLLLTQKAKS